MPTALPLPIKGLAGFLLENGLYGVRGVKALSSLVPVVLRARVEAAAARFCTTSRVTTMLRMVDAAFIFSRLFFSRMTSAFICPVILFSRSWSWLALAERLREAMYRPDLTMIQVTAVLYTREMPFEMTDVMELARVERPKAMRKQVTMMAAEMGTGKRQGTNGQGGTRRKCTYT
jgi:hypothetical protein